MNDDSIDPGKEACVLYVPACGTAWVQTSGTIASASDNAVAAELHTLIRAREATGQTRTHLERREAS